MKVAEADARVLTVDPAMLRCSPGDSDQSMSEPQ
jgi:hypothetical protein